MRTHTTPHDTQALADRQEPPLQKWDCLLHHEQYLNSRGISHRDFPELTDTEAIDLATRRDLIQPGAGPRAARQALFKVLRDAQAIDAELLHAWTCENRCRHHVPAYMKRPSPRVQEKDRP